MKLIETDWIVVCAILIVVLGFLEILLSNGVFVGIGFLIIACAMVRIARLLLKD